MGVNPETSAESQPSAKLDQYSFGEYNLQVASFPHGLILSSLEPSKHWKTFYLRKYCTDCQEETHSAFFCRKPTPENLCAQRAYFEGEFGEGGVPLGVIRKQQTAGGRCG